MLTIGFNHVATLTNDTKRLHAFYREVFDAEILTDGSEFSVAVGRGCRSSSSARMQS